jgi:Cu/Ag efflux protein CusF
MKTRVSILACLLAVWVVAPFSLGFAAGHKEKQVGAAITETAVAVDTIVAIDKESRTITLKNAEGEEWVFVAGPEVRNFDQLQRGDLVIMDYFAGFALELGPKGSGKKSRVSNIKAERARLGEKPGMQITGTTYAVGEVTAIDKKHRKVTLQGPKNTLVLRASDEVDLSQIKVGQEVEATYIESFVVSVVPAPKVSGTVKIKSTSVALGIGVEWGKGSLKMYDGTTHGFKINGLSVLDIGVSSIEATGEVYNLVEAKDLQGSFVSGEVGAALVAGGAAIAMKNENGVVMKLKSTQQGVKLSVAGKGMTLQLQ